MWNQRATDVAKAGIGALKYLHRQIERESVKPFPQLTSNADSKYLVLVLSIASSRSSEGKTLLSFNGMSEQFQC